MDGEFVLCMLLASLLLRNVLALMLVVMEWDIIGQTKKKTKKRMAQGFLSVSRITRSLCKTAKPEDSETGDVMLQGFNFSVFPCDSMAACLCLFFKVALEGVSFLVVRFVSFKCMLHTFN